MGGPEGGSSGGEQCGLCLLSVYYVLAGISVQCPSQRLTVRGRVGVPTSCLPRARRHPRWWLDCLLGLFQASLSLSHPNSPALGSQSSDHAELTKAISLMEKLRFKEVTSIARDTRACGSGRSGMGTFYSSFFFFFGFLEFQLNPQLTSTLHTRAVSGPACTRGALGVWEVPVRGLPGLCPVPCPRSCTCSVTTALLKAHFTVLFRGRSTGFWMTPVCRSFWIRLPQTPGELPGVGAGRAGTFSGVLWGT